MWNLYQNGKFLKPLIFSNGKSQEDVVREILDSIKDGKKVILIRGVCGTGKSAIALNVARKLGKTSIIVPGKNLQNQYKKDYEKDKYILKDNNEKLKISVITGRSNHVCKFMEDKKKNTPIIKREVNAKLHDIFEFNKEDRDRKKREDFSADRYDLPCKIEIKEKNFRKIKEYLKQNKNITSKNILSISDIKRTPVASVCPYWSPVLPDKYTPGKDFAESKRTYEGLNNTKFTIYKRKPGCKFYEQFNYYIDSDVIVFNSLKYHLESALNRKPLTEAEIIDEGDEFLDSFSNQRNINLDRLQNSLIMMAYSRESTEKVINELNGIIKQIKKDKNVEKAIYSDEIISLKNTGIYDILKIFLNSQGFLEDIDDESYLFDVEETARMFEDFLEESYTTFNKRDGNIIVNIVTTNLAKRFKEMLDKNKIIILMSGTLHSEKVLKEIFGLEDFKIIEAETEQQGTISVKKTGLEMDCKYENFSRGIFNREQYLKALNKCVEIAKKPVLIHVNSFSDLPDKEEIKKFEVYNLVSRMEMREAQIMDKTGYLIEEFKNGKTDYLFTTRCSRGIDFPGEQCRSIIFTKYPHPNIKDAFWRILRKTHPNQYWEFYKDKSRRELLQKIYRGLRFKEDHINLLSPDIRVLRAFEK